MKIPVKNNTRNAMYLRNGTMIPPGETAHVEERDAPAAFRPKAAPAEPAAPVHPLDALLAKPIPEILAAAKDLSREELHALGQREFDGTRREGLLKSLQEAMYARIEADDKAQEEARLEALAKAKAEAEAKAKAEAEAKAKAEAEAEAAAAQVAADLSAKSEKEVLAAIAGGDLELVTRLIALELERAKSRGKVLDALDARRTALEKAAKG